MPAFASAVQKRQAAFVDAVQTRLQTMAAANVCGYIIDLRFNDGGSMNPMLAALSPLLGNGVVGFFVYPAQRADMPSRSEPWVLKDGFIGKGITKAGASQYRPIQGGETAPVALLVDSQTASAAEAVLR